MDAPLPLSPARAAAPRQPTPLRRAVWTTAVWLAFMAVLDRRVLLPWIAPAGWSEVAARALTGAALTLCIFALEERFPLLGPGWARRLPVHAAGALVFAVAAVAVVFPLHQRLAPDPTLHWRDAVLSSLHWHFMLYWFILGVRLAQAGSARLLESERAAAALRTRAARLEADFAHARLHALRMQMQPHFLFNTLNALSELIHVDAARASEVAGELAGLLRLTLAADAQCVPLRDELALLERYLAIQRTRFGDRLQLSVEVAEGVADTLVPGMMLQPLVENALRHGMPERGGVQRVWVTAGREGGWLVLRVRDNGPGPRAGRGERIGVAMENVRARLSHLYGDEAWLELTAAPDGPGALAEISIPIE